MAEIQNKVAGLRRFGAASLDMAFVAAGRLDGYWERNLQAWDMAAGQIMVREAGGIVCGIEGDDDPLKTGNVICGNEFVHAELVKILKPLGSRPPVRSTHPTHWSKIERVRVTNGCGRRNSAM